MKPVVLSAFAGYRNDIAAERFKPGDLSEAMNIDIDETGQVARRSGFAQKIAGAAHSIWTNGTLTLAVRGTSLCAIDGATATLIASGITGSRVSFCDALGQVFWSDGVQSGVISNGVNRQWGVPVPAAPVLTTTTGTLPAATYGVCVSHIRADGHEGGASLIAWQAVNGSQGIVVTLAPSALTRRIYLTMPNGDTPYAVGDVPAGSTQATISALPTLSVAVRTQFLGPAPAGQFVFEYRGRLYVASGSELYASQPNEPELFSPVRDLDFGERITLACPMQSGIFIGTARQVVFLSGTSPAEFARTVVAAYGAIEGTQVIPVRHDIFGAAEDPAVYAAWLSPKGVCVGSADGSVRNFTKDRVTLSQLPAVGAGVIKRVNGTWHYLATCGANLSLVVNCTTVAAWFYSYAFNSYAAIEDSTVLASGPAGIVQIDAGDLDGETPILPRMTSGNLPIAGGAICRVPAIHLAADIPESLSLRVSTDAAQSVAYTVLPRASGLHQTRVEHPAKGQRGRNWQLSVSTSGAGFRLDSISITTAPLVRGV